MEDISHVLEDEDMGGREVREEAFLDAGSKLGYYTRT